MITPQSKLVAVLGPTNTGKTFTAIEKMLEFNSGIFGLPLRLLAREVYDKCVSKVGQEKVALRKNYSQHSTIFHLYCRSDAKK